MRKIEQQVCEAIRSGKDFKEGSSRVEHIEFLELPTRAYYYLHDNNIAEIHHDCIKINHCGYITATTRSRLNALLIEFCGPGYGVSMSGGRFLVRMPSEVKGCSWSWQVMESNARWVTIKRPNHTSTPKTEEL
jgi:hypothetical protein